MPIIRLVNPANTSLKEYKAMAMTTIPTTDNAQNEQAESKPLPTTGNTRIMPLAQYLGVHHHTVRRWIKQGKIPKPKKVNGIALFDNAKIHEWLDSQQTA